MLRLYELTWRERKGKRKPLKQKKREYEAKLERLRKERSLGTSFDGQAGGNSADRRGTAVSTMGPMWTRGVSTDGGLREGSPYFLGMLYQNIPWNALPTSILLGRDVLRFFKPTKVCVTLSPLTLLK